MFINKKLSVALTVFLEVLSFSFSAVFLFISYSYYSLSPQRGSLFSRQLFNIKLQYNSILSFLSIGSSQRREQPRVVKILPQADRVYLALDVNLFLFRNS